MSQVIAVELVTKGGEKVKKELDEIKSAGDDLIDGADQISGGL